MQLNNIKNGRVVTIMVSYNGIVYYMYENDIHSNNNTYQLLCDSISTTIDKSNVPPLPNNSLYDNEQLLGLNIIKQLPIFNNDDWELSLTNKNWIYDERPIRILIPRNFATFHISKQTDLGKLIIYVLSNIQQGIIDLEDNQFIMCYLQYIEPAHRQLISQYSEITIEELSE